MPGVGTDDFAELFRVHYPRLIRALSLTGATLPTAEDVTQEAFARTLARWKSVRHGINPAGYVFRVAFRLLGRRGLVPTTPWDDDLVTPAMGFDDAATTRVDLERLLEQMPPRRRVCVLLCWVLDVSTADAAEALGIAPGTVRKQLELARRQVRAPEPS